MRQDAAMMTLLSEGRDADQWARIALAGDSAIPTISSLASSSCFVSTHASST